MSLAWLHNKTLPHYTAYLKTSRTIVLLTTSVKVIIVKEWSLSRHKHFLVIAWYKQCEVVIFITTLLR